MAGIPVPPLRRRMRRALAAPNVHVQQTERYDTIVHDIEDQMPGCLEIIDALEGVADPDEPGKNLLQAFWQFHLHDRWYATHQKLIQMLGILAAVPGYVDHNDVAAFRDYHINHRHDAGAAFPFEGIVPPPPPPPPAALLALPLAVPIFDGGPAEPMELD